MSAYFCTIVEACLHLWSQNEWMLEEPWEYTCCLLMVTRSLGGYPITIYSQFCIRAVQDVLSTNLHLIETIREDAILSKYISRAVNLDIDGRKDFLSLIKDPQSIPLNIPVQPENCIKREVKKGLETFIVNENVKKIFSLEAIQEQKALIKDLSNIEPCNPKLLNKLYALSNIGLQERWAGMFANTRSIQQLAFKNWSDKKEVVDAIQNMERKYIIFNYI